MVTALRASAAAAPLLNHGKLQNVYRPVTGNNYIVLKALQVKCFHIYDGKGRMS